MWNSVSVEMNVVPCDLNYNQYEMCKDDNDRHFVTIKVTAVKIASSLYLLSRQDTTT